MSQKADDYQIGGEHYRNKNIPAHWDVVYALGWDYLTGCATKYLWRLGKKYPSRTGQLQDLDKAIHYLMKKRELLVAEIEEDNQTLRASVDKAATEMGVLGMPPAKKKKTLTLAELLDEDDAKCGPTSGYVNQDR